MCSIVIGIFWKNSTLFAVIIFGSTPPPPTPPRPPLARQLALSGYAVRRKTRREVRMLELPAVIAQSRGERERWWNQIRRQKKALASFVNIFPLRVQLCDCNAPFYLICCSHIQIPTDTTAEPFFSILKRYTEITHDPFSLVLRKEYFDCPQRDSHSVHYI
jgi:hypothetical protein